MMTCIVPGSIIGRATHEDKRNFFNIMDKIVVFGPIILSYEKMDRLKISERDRLLKKYRLIADDENQEFKCFKK